MGSWYWGGFLGRGDSPGAMFDKVKVNLADKFYHQLLRGTLTGRRGTSTA